MINWYLLKSYFRYLLISKHMKGYGIHSPFVFDLVRNIIYSKSKFYHFKTINSVRKEYLNVRDRIEISDYGAGSKIKKSSQRKVRNIAKYSSIPQKYGELLFRIVVHFKPDNIIELGTSLGLSTLYLALPDRRKKVYTIDACTSSINIAQTTFNELKLNNVNVRIGTFEDLLGSVIDEMKSIDLAFIDGNHRKNTTLNYFERCLVKSNNETIFVFDDIHWSKEMYDAWKIISSHPKVTVAIDLFRIGIVFLRGESLKQHFVVRF